MRHSNWNVSRLGREGKPEGRGWDPSKKGSDRWGNGLKWPWELGWWSRGRDVILHGMGREIPFPMRGGLFLKGAGIEVLLLEPLEAPCQVETLCPAKNKRRSHGWWKFGKYIGNPKRNKEKEIRHFLGLTDLLVEVRGMHVMNSFGYFFSR